LRRILVIRGGAIGDFILTLPAIRLLREAFPAAHLEILGYQHIVRLAVLSGYANAMRSIEYGPLAGFFVPGGELAPELIEYFAGSQQVVSYLFDPDEIFAHNLQRAGVQNLIAASPKITNDEHAAQQLARPLEQLGLCLDDRAPRILPNELRKVDQNLIAIHPGSGSERKNWPSERFMALATLLLERPQTRILLIGGEADESSFEALQGNLPNDRIELARNLPLADLARRVRDCAWFLGHDTGISHLAAAVGTPSVLLFGPTDPAIWAPQNPQVRIVRAPCLTMLGIEQSAVMAAARELTAMY